MNTLNLVKVIILSTLIMYFNLALAEDTVNHDDPVARSQILNYARSLENHKESAKYYVYAINNWQGDDELKKKDLDSACDYLFELMFLSERHTLNENKELLKGCSDEKQDFWYGQSDRKYKAIYKYGPIYPFFAIDKKIEGWATVIYDIDEKGHTINIRIKESSHNIFNKPSIRATKKFRYLPARRNGELVVSKNVKNKFNFKL